jgi:hypothetical protein
LLLSFEKPVLFYDLNPQVLLRYFRINDPYRLIGLLAISLILFVPAIADAPPLSIPELKSILIGGKISHGAAPYTHLIDSTAPLTSWFYGLMDLVFGKSVLARHIVAFLIILAQSIYIGFVFINRKVFSESTYLPSLLFVILYSFSYDTLALTGELIGSGFLLLALNNLFKELEYRSKRDDIVLGLGLYISLASLSSFAYCIYFFGAGVILVVYSRRELRVFLLLLTGFALPHLLLISSYFMAGHTESLLQFYYTPNLQFRDVSLMNLTGLLYLSGVPILFLVMSLLILNREARFSKYQSQILQSMFLWLAFTIIQIMYAKGLRPQSLITAVPPISYFISNFLLLIRRRRIAEWSLWTLFLGVMLVSNLARYQRLPKIKYDRLQVSTETNKDINGKRIVVLGDNINYYQGNELATPFMDWRLSRSIFVDLDYYKNVIRIAEGFNEDLPDVIVDPEQLMRGVFGRIPYLKKHYRQERPGWYVRTN